MPARPAGLPEFSSPPLVEVVLGVQFQPLQPYSSVHHGLLWQRISDRYPKFRDQLPLTPIFETFSKRPAPQAFPFAFSTGIEAPRVWFLSDSETELFQLQPDRALHNWRIHGEERQYPRYEQIRAAFLRDLTDLMAFAESAKLGPMVITQAEVTYINVIQSSGQDTNSQIHDAIGAVIPLWNDGVAHAALPELESTAFRLTSIVRNNLKPIGRLHVTCDPVLHAANGLDALKLELTVRGLPESESIEDALHFIDIGRNEIVKAFAAITSPEIHKEWGRTS